MKQSTKDKISKSLKKYHKEKKLIQEIFESLPKVKKEFKNELQSQKTRNRITKSNKPITKRKTNVKTSNKSVKRKTSKSVRDSKGFTTTRIRKRVKTFPEKRNKANFFYSDKLKINFDEKLNIKSEFEIKQLKENIKSTKPELKKFYEKSKGKKRNKKMNIGYELKMTFYAKGMNKNLPPSKVPNSQKTVIKTTSFLKPVILNKKTQINQSIDILNNEIEMRFLEYLVNKALGNLICTGIEAELEN